MPFMDEMLASIIRCLMEKALLSTLEISSSKKIKLIDQCVSMVKTIVLKLQARSPLKYLIVRCSSCLVPCSIVNESESVILQFNKVADKLIKHQQLNNKEADEAKLQSEEYVINLCDIQDLYEDPSTPL